MPGPAPSAARSDPTSSKADLRSLLGNNDSNGRGAPPPKNKLDDIMNLGGGGVYSPALMAPVLTAPSMDFSTVAADPVASDGKPKSKGLLFAIIGGVILIGGGVAFTMMGKGDATDKTSAGASATAPLAAAPTATDTPTTAKAPDPVATAAPAPTPEAAPTVISPGQAAPKPEPAEHKATPKAAAAEPKAAPAEPKAAPAAPAAEAKPAPAAPAAGGSGDFDRAAALSALSSAATSAQSCRKADGPTGAGRIAVTFANNGSATTANVEGPPFAGTPVGGCVAARFRGAHVPPFGGAPVTVHKSFNIN
jgi:outer membrane biosynthesis protein TonB